MPYSRATARNLLARFRTPRAIFGASSGDLLSVPEVSETRLRRIVDFSDWKRVEHEVQMIQEHKVRVVTVADPAYPEALRQMDDTPILLYMKGTLADQDRLALAVVGSRAMSDYGRRVTERICMELASLGITVVSGLARGIDTASHRAALSGGGRTIAVLGTGIDRPYPPENRQLMEDVQGSGCVISEFPMGTPPNKENFPRRNRLISGLSSGVLVVEAAAGSGALITAHYALEQNKEVFAVPGNVTARNSSGTNMLIKKGAKLVEGVRDILEELSPLYRALLGDTGKTADRERRTALEISVEEKAICNALEEEPLHIDELSRKVQIPAARLLTILLELEMKGIVKQREGKRFSLD